MAIIKCNSITPLRDGILVKDMGFDEQITDSGIIINSDDGKSEGIKPRWALVYAVGKNQTSVKTGDWILVEHGRWTRGVSINVENDGDVTIRRVEPKSVIMTSDNKPSDVYFGKSNHSTVETFDFSRPMF